MKISVIGIVNEELKKDLWGTLNRLADMGYQGIETGPALFEQAGVELKDAREKLQEIGLEVVAIGARKESLQEDPDSHFAKAEALGCNRLVFYWGPVESKEQLLKDAADYDALGALCRDRGFDLMYHNHEHEFQKIDGKYALDILMDATDPDNFKVNLDAAWILYGGADPVEVIKKYAGRCPVLHVKDFVQLEEGYETASAPREKAKFTEVGTGVLPLQAVVDAARSAGVEWVTVEQDRLRDLPPMESVRVSFENVKTCVG